MILTWNKNAPNPFNSDTKIRYYLSPVSTSSTITITTATGQILKTVSLRSKGSGEINISGKELLPGTYFYSLFVNGKLADSKQMLIIK